MNTDTKTRIEIIEDKLRSALNPQSIQVIDDSAQHIGHPGASQGAGHYTVIIVSNAFENLSAVKRHQLVYAALQDMIPNDIHAVQIKALTPDQV